MNTTISRLFVLCIGMMTGCGTKHSTTWQSIKDPDIATQLKSFVAEKQSQAAATPNTPWEIKTFFTAAQNGDWIGVSNIFQDLKHHAPQYEGNRRVDARLNGPAWETVKETWGGFEGVYDGGEKYSRLYATEIINSIPPGSVYFGGTDPGRFLITAMQKSHVHGNPFYTITQNAIVDATYLEYLRQMYGRDLYVPGTDDISACFEDYRIDVQKRKESNQLKPGENISTDANGRSQVSGQTAVMAINGLLAKMIFDQTTNRAFYVEESFPLDWMYPCLEPNGVIMKIDRQPLTGLSDEIVHRDTDYWSKLISPMIGDWLDKNTSIADVTAFTEKVYLKNDLGGFTGDKEFVQNDYFMKTFSKERTSIAGLYAWRGQQATDDAEKRRMNDAADFAFRQALALCPYSPETVTRYVNLLVSENKISDALLIAETAAKFKSKPEVDARQFESLVDSLKQTPR